MSARILLLTLIVPLALSSVALAQPRTGDPYRRVEPAAAPGDKPDIWTLAFEYVPPRIKTITLPGIGTRAVWYMPYRIYNPTKLPQQVNSLRLELVTKDLNTVHNDEPQPSLFETIRQLEDPEHLHPYETTVGIAKEKIPVTRADSYPRYVYGIAIWTDVPERAGKTNRFSIYVSGLSDGITSEIVGDIRKVKVKTLQLDFFKPTDDNNPGSTEIKSDDNRGLGGERWMYRSAGVKTTAPAEKK